MKPNSWNVVFAGAVSSVVCCCAATAPVGPVASLRVKGPTPARTGPDVEVELRDFVDAKFGGSLPEYRQEILGQMVLALDRLVFPEISSMASRVDRYNIYEAALFKTMIRNKDVQLLLKDEVEQHWRERQDETRQEELIKTGTAVFDQVFDALHFTRKIVLAHHAFANVLDRDFELEVVAKLEPLLDEYVGQLSAESREFMFFELSTKNYHRPLAEALRKLEGLAVDVVNSLDQGDLQAFLSALAAKDPAGFKETYNATSKRVFKDALGRFTPEDVSRNSERVIRSLDKQALSMLFDIDAVTETRFWVERNRAKANAFLNDCVQKKRCRISEVSLKRYVRTLETEDEFTAAIKAFNADGNIETLAEGYRFQIRRSILAGLDPRAICDTLLVFAVSRPNTPELTRFAARRDEIIEATLLRLRPGIKLWLVIHDILSNKKDRSVYGDLDARLKSSLLALAPEEKTLVWKSLLPAHDVSVEKDELPAFVLAAVEQALTRHQSDYYPTPFLTSRHVDELADAQTFSAAMIVKDHLQDLKTDAAKEGLARRIADRMSLEDEEHVVNGHDDKKTREIVSKCRRVIETEEKQALAKDQAKHTQKKPVEKALQPLLPEPRGPTVKSPAKPGPRQRAS